LTNQQGLFEMAKRSNRVGSSNAPCSFVKHPQILADGKLYLFSLEGKTTVIEPRREFKVLAMNGLATDAPLEDPIRQKKWRIRKVEPNRISGNIIAPPIIKFSEIELRLFWADRDDRPRLLSGIQANESMRERPHALPRRTFLKASGISLAIPALESFMPQGLN